LHVRQNGAEEQTSAIVSVAYKLADVVFF